MSEPPTKLIIYNSESISAFVILIGTIVLFMFCSNLSAFEISHAIRNRTGSVPTDTALRFFISPFTLTIHHHQKTPHHHYSDLER